MDDERDAVRIFAFEQPLDCAGDRPPDEQVARLFLEQAKLRIDARRDGVPAEKDRAKRVDRADSRSVDLPQDRQPIIDVPRCAVVEPPRAGGPDAVAHLTGRAVGERDRDELRRAGRPPNDHPQMAAPDGSENRSVRTKVLPQPAPAERPIETERVSIAAACSGV